MSKRRKTRVPRIEGYPAGFCPTESSEGEVWLEEEDAKMRSRYEKSLDADGNDTKGWTKYSPPIPEEGSLDDPENLRRIILSMSRIARRGRGFMRVSVLMDPLMAHYVNTLRAMWGSNSAAAVISSILVYYRRRNPIGEEPYLYIDTAKKKYCVMFIAEGSVPSWVDAGEYTTDERTFIRNMRDIYADLVVIHQQQRNGDEDEPTTSSDKL